MKNSEITQVEKAAWKFSYGGSDVRELAEEMAPKILMVCEELKRLQKILKLKRLK